MHRPTFRVFGPMQGLTVYQAEEKLESDGPNQLTPPRELPAWMKFVKQMFLGFNILLWISAALSFLTYGIQFTQMPDPPPDNVRFWALVLWVIDYETINHINA